MSDKLEKPTRANFSIDKAHHVLTLGVIAVLLYAVGIPFYVIFFLGAFAFFLWKIFAHGSGGEVRAIFEFYLRSSEMLREDSRRWYGFEVQNTIDLGEKILRSTSAAPPLVQFTLAALYRKAGDHSSSLRLLEELYNSGEDRESEIMYPTPMLKEYVRILRKIERSPGEAPLTASAVRSLERLRRNKGMDLLAEMREYSVAERPQITNDASDTENYALETVSNDGEKFSELKTLFADNSDPGDHDSAGGAEKSKTPTAPERQSISELLRDLYDDNVS